MKVTDYVQFLFMMMPTVVVIVAAAVTILGL